ncbi:MAG: type IV pilin [Asgard group archaeon]|nr:type IV pilin [Asgard group archaeon]
MKMILKRKKAVSPVIAPILLIALTVTAAAIVYFVVVPLLRANPDLVYTNHGKVAGTDNKYEIAIQNNGGADANLAGLTAFTFDNGTAYNPAHVYYSVADEITEWPYVIAQGSTVTLICEMSGAFTGGSQYTFTLEYDNGKSFDFVFTY